jgi:hypothetical protein
LFLLNILTITQKPWTIKMYDECEQHHQILSVSNFWELCGPLHLFPHVKTLHIECTDHKVRWPYFPLGSFHCLKTLKELTIDVPFAFTNKDAIAMAKFFPNIDTLYINVLLVKDPRFFEELANFNLLIKLTLLMNTCFQKELNDWKIFAVKSLQTLVIICSSFDIHALISYAAVCITPTNLETLIIERPASDRGNLRNKRHVKLQPGLKYEIELITQVEPCHEFKPYDRIFMDAPVRILFPSLKHIFICPQFGKEHNLSQTKGLGKIIAKQKGIRSEIMVRPCKKKMKLTF